MAKPIVIVPGIMGTRLINPAGRSLWDPDEGLSLDNVRGLRELMDVTNPAVPNPRATPLVEAILRARGVVNGGNLVWGRGYNNLVLGLSAPRFAQECGESIKVYCAGYDWRQSNVISARRVLTVIEQALRETEADQVILVAHSMGGLISRIICKFAQIGGAPAAAKVERLLLLGSRVHGAPKAYRALRQSFATPDELGDAMISDIDLRDELPNESLSGLAGRALSGLVRRLPATYELLPTAAFCSAEPNWVRFDTRRAGFADASNLVALYANRYTGVNGNPAFLRIRHDLDSRLGVYVPPQTVVLYSSGLATEMNLRIAANGELENAGPPASNRGDGTVPTLSGSAAASTASGLVREDLRTIDHGGLANDPAAVRRIAHHIQTTCRQVRIA